MTPVALKDPCHTSGASVRPAVRPELAGHQVAVAAVAPVLAGAVAAYRAALDASCPPTDDYWELVDRYDRFSAESGAAELRAALAELADLIALADVPAGRPLPRLGV